jgi:hypothetical protein
MAPDSVPFLGIDFGTSRSAMAWFNPKTGQAETLLNSEGEQHTPSFVYFGEGMTLVGTPAENMLEDPHERARVVMSVKSELARTPFLPLPGGRKRPVEVAAAILAKLKADAEELYFHQPVERAVITYPAAFELLQRDDIAAAGRLAGFSEVVLLEEPVAAALAFADAGQHVGKHVLVYDLGGGTFDLALLVREEDGTFAVALEPKGLARCGGDDFDRALYGYCDEQAQVSLGRLISLGDTMDPQFLHACRLRKENLTTQGQCMFSSFLLGQQGAIRFHLSVDRGTFENLIGPHVEQTLRLTELLVKQANEAALSVDTVVLIGGSTRVPLIQQRLQEILPVAPVRWQKQDVAVALGAAYYGGRVFLATEQPARDLDTESIPQPPDVDQPAPDEGSSGELAGVAQIPAPEVPLVNSSSTPLKGVGRFRQPVSSDVSRRTIGVAAAVLAVLLAAVVAATLGFTHVLAADDSPIDAMQQVLRRDAGGPCFALHSALPSANNAQCPVTDQLLRQVRRLKPAIDPICRCTDDYYMTMVRHDSDAQTAHVTVEWQALQPWRITFTIRLVGANFWGGGRWLVDDSVCAGRSGTDLDATALVRCGPSADPPVPAP